MKIRFFALCLVWVFLAVLAAADDDHHHFDPNEKLGTVSFPTSCAPAVQKSFERSVALLHSFGYEEANEQFQQVAAKDPSCAMGYWGQAMSLYHQLWSRPTAADLKTGHQLMEKAQAIKAKTEREQKYIDALATFYSEADPASHEKRAKAYAESMKRLADAFPQDHEAAVFYALSLLASSRRETEVENHRQAIAILNKLFEQQPDHPGIAHYLIHSCDSPQFAQLGLAAARRYAGIAPSSPHAIHMPSHIFARLGLWQDDIQSNLSALQVAQKQGAMHMHVAHHQMHSLDFLQYAYLQVGDNAKAKGMQEELDHIRKADVDAEFMSYLNGTRADFPARYALENRQWKDAVALQPEADWEPYTRAITYWANAIGAGHLKDAAAARKAMDNYNAMVEATRKSDRPHYADNMDSDRDEAAAWLAYAEGKNDDALRLLRGVAERQDKLGKGEVALPAREMMADMLLEMGRAQEALAEYETSLHTDPNRFNGLYGAARAAELTKQSQKANEYYAQLLKNCANGAHSDRPELARAKTLIAKN